MYDNLYGFSQGTMYVILEIIKLCLLPTAGRVYPLTMSTRVIARAGSVLYIDVVRASAKTTINSRSARLFFFQIQVPNPEKSALGSLKTLRSSSKRTRSD